MQRYLLHRLLLALPTIVGLTIIVFAVLRIASRSDPVTVLLGSAGTSDPQLEERLREDLGLTGSIPAQYVNWVGGLFRGDLGTSVITRRPIVEELPGRFLVSFELGALGLLIALLVSVPIGTVSALHQDRWPDYLFRSMAILSTSIPGFWMAILVITFGGIWFHWAPSLEFTSLGDDPMRNIKSLLLPAFLTALAPTGGLVRVVRTQMLEVLRQDYVRTARAKGLSSNVVTYRHALRNALLPVVTVIGLQLPALVAGTVIFERIFSLPGSGNYLITAVTRLDYPVIQATNLMFGLVIVASTLLVDLSYAWLDPRIRFR
ncbi:MAG: ABC transporter permease [Chloroflexi bacterium]|nr:ABC transporter permease [Chloroflexota bacterium]